MIGFSFSFTAVRALFDSTFLFAFFLVQTIWIFPNPRGQRAPVLLTMLEVKWVRKVANQSVGTNDCHT